MNEANEVKKQKSITQLIEEIDTCLLKYSCDFVDWEEMHFNKSYKPEFPKHLTLALKELKRQLYASLNRRPN